MKDSAFNSGQKDKVARLLTRLFDLFSANKITLRVTLPKGLNIEHSEEKVTFIGTTDEISAFAHEIRKIAKFKDGALVSVDRYIFKVSDYKTEDGFRNNWIELPGRGWGVMSSKFLEVVEGYEENPFWFNSCGYTDKLPLDIGVEVTDLKKEMKDELQHAPPAELDGAQVIKWAWSGDRPFGVMPFVDDEREIEIYGLAICRYKDTSQVYRFSCSSDWEVQNDAPYDSIEEAMKQLPDQYRNVEAEWYDA
ncbi:hypothetical protein [Chryseolinea soli]|nr:hypothetical protein [Chryseolinea soli]